MTKNTQTTNTQKRPFFSEHQRCFSINGTSHYSILIGAIRNFAKITEFWHNEAFTQCSFTLKHK